MIRILLDECLPIKLKYRFQEDNPDFQVSTVTGEKLTGTKNGKLLSLVQKQFDVFITIDQNLPHQQELSKFDIAVVALGAESNRYQDLIRFVKAAANVVKMARAGKFYEVTLP